MGIWRTTTTGAWVDNYAYKANLPVSVGNSSFSANSQDGIVIFTKGMVTLNKVKADLNITGGGAYIYHDTASNAVMVRGGAAGDNSFSGNGGTGLYIYTYAGIQINYSDVSYNLSNGTILINWDIARYPMSISNSDFSSNGGSGINIASLGNITINNIVSSGNDDTGMNLKSYSITSAVNKVSVTNSDFSYNNKRGIQLGAMGSITMNNVSANFNGEEGARIGNAYQFYAYPEKDVVAIIAIANSSFDSNGKTGLTINSYGIVTLKQVSASNNKGIGADIKNSDALAAKSILISASSFNGNNFERGLSVISKGAITLTDVGASNNSRNDEIDRIGRLHKRGSCVGYLS